MHIVSGQFDLNQTRDSSEFIGGSNKAIELNKTSKGVHTRNDTNKSKLQN